MARLIRTVTLPALLFLVAGCAEDYSSILYPSQQVVHDFFTAVDLDEKTGEWIDVKTEFYPDDEQIALVVKLDEFYVYEKAEIFYELVSPGGFIVEVERKTYKRDVPTGVFFDIPELVHKARVVSTHDGEVLQDGYGAWTGNFYVDGIALGQVKFEIINPDAEKDEAEESTDTDEYVDYKPASEDTHMTPEEAASEIGKAQ